MTLDPQKSPKAEKKELELPKDLKPKLEEKDKSPLQTEPKPEAQDHKKTHLETNKSPSEMKKPAKIEKKDEEKKPNLKDVSSQK